MREEDEIVKPKLDGPVRCGRKELFEEQGCQELLKNISPGSHNLVATLYERERQLRRTKISGWSEWFEWG